MSHSLKEKRFLISKNSKTLQIIGKNPHLFSIFILLSLLITLSLFGCSDARSSTWIEVDNFSSIDSEMRSVVVTEISSSNLNAIHIQNDIWIAVGQNGIIERSTDKGKNWIYINSNTDENLYAIHGKDNVLLAVGEAGVILRSTDYGKTWIKVESDTNRYLRAIYADQDILVAVGNDIVRSEDDGKTWEKTSISFNARLMDIDGYNNKIITVGWDGVVLQSVDRGKTWSLMSSKTNKRLYRTLVKKGLLLAVGDNGVIVRYDYKQRYWEVVEHSEMYMENIWNYRYFSSIYSNDKFIVAIGDKGTIIRSIDNGKSWSKVESYTESELNDMYSEKSLLVAVGGEGAIIRSENQGADWSIVDSGVDYDLNAIEGNGSTLVAVGQGGKTRSTDGGKTWSPLGSPTSNGLEKIYGNGDILVGIGDYGVIIRSTDMGKTWTQINSPVDESFIDIYGVGDLLVAVGHEYVLKSSDAGQSWDIALHNDNLSLSEVSGYDSSIAVLSSNHIIRSDDKGKTWKPSGLFPKKRNYYSPYSSFYLDRDILIVAGEDGTIIRSVDQGVHWEQVDVKTKDWFTKIYSITPQNNNRVLIALGSNGAIARSANNGLSWQVQKLNSNSLDDLYSDGSLLIAVGRNGHIVRSVDAGINWQDVNYDNISESFVAINGDSDILVAVSLEGTLIQSHDAGKSWSSTGQVIDSYLRDLYSIGNTWVAVGSDGRILKARADGKKIPYIQRVEYRQGYPGELSLRFKVLDTDLQCLEGCTLMIFAGNEQDFMHKRAFNPLSSKPQIIQHEDNIITWEATFSPKDFNVHSNEMMYFEALLSGSNFSLHHSGKNITRKPFRVPFQINKTPFYFLGSIISVVSLLLLQFWIKPLSIIVLYRRAGLFEFAEKLTVPGFSSIFQLIGNCLLLPYLVHHPRVLDAWLEKHKSKFEMLFEIEKAVHNQHYYPLPLRRLPTNKRINSPCANDFICDFSCSRTLIELIGVGGAGKTTFAAQLAIWGKDGLLLKHQVIPMWIDEDFDDLEALLIKRVRMISCDDKLPDSFIKALYKNKRFLVIIDRLSEKQTTTQSAVKGLPGFVNALVITTRTQSDLKLPEIKVIKAVPLCSENLMGFVNELLEVQIKKDIYFNNFKTQLGLAKCLADAITLDKEELPVTPLLVNLFVARAIDQVKNSTIPLLDKLPQNIPEVYFDYLRGVNPTDVAAENYLPNDIMLEATMVIAREELGSDFRPKRVTRRQLQLALQPIMIERNSDPIQRLLDNHVLQEKHVGGSSLIDFVQDPIAEYVAAFSYCEEFGSEQPQLQSLINQVEECGKQAQGFMEALYITYVVFSSDFGWVQNVTWPKGRVINCNQNK